MIDHFAVPASPAQESAFDSAARRIAAELVALYKDGQLAARTTRGGGPILRKVASKCSEPAIRSG